MSVSREYVTFLLDQLAPLGAVDTRRMFGCVALFQAGRMFALVDGDAQVYIKADAQNRELFIAQGFLPFTYLTTRLAAASRQWRLVITTYQRSWWRIARNYYAGRAKGLPPPGVRQRKNRVKPRDKMAQCPKRTIIDFFSYNILKTIQILFCNVSAPPQQLHKVKKAANSRGGAWKTGIKKARRAGFKTLTGKKGVFRSRCRGGRTPRRWRRNARPPRDEDYAAPAAPLRNASGHREIRGYRPRRQSPGR